MNYNIILINIDGFRSDKIELCPTLKEFRNENIYFSNMFTAAPYTFASLHAIFSSMYPSKNGMNAYYNIKKFKKNEITTLQEILRNNGYYTCCDIISKVVLPNQGFDEIKVFDELNVNFNERHKKIIKDLAKKEKFFLFLHYTETHKNLVRDIVEKYKLEDNDDEYFKNKEENNQRFNSYLPSCDSYISTIIDTLKEEGIYEKSIIVLFADHGTSIGEKKGEKFYGVYLYDYTLKVFSIMKIPNTLKQKFNQQCSTIDLYPTILELVGIKHDNAIQGNGLMSIINNLEKNEREIFAETGGLYGPWASPNEHNVFCVRKDNKKIIFNKTPKTWEFYDLLEDPNEENNQYDLQSVEVLKMKEKLINHMDKNNIEM